MSQTILITGAGGLLGQNLIDPLKARGLTVRTLSHRDPAWNWADGSLDPKVLEGTDTVIHLAGEPIADKRWSQQQKERIRNSRVVGTRALATAMAQTANGPRTLLCASAVGLYGDRGDECLTESSPAGSGFLPGVVKAWEAAASPARDAGIRVVHLRLGIVLAADGGAMAKMLPPFRMGLGGPLGSGKAWMSWIHIEDAVRAIEFTLDHPETSGAYNLVSPHSVTNKDFSRTLASTLSRPCWFPVPPFLLRLLLGDMADEALLASTRATPQRLEEAGFRFEFPDPEAALSNLLKD